MIKEVESIVQGFDWKRVSWQDKEYLVNMVHDTINSKSYLASGVPFSAMFNDADNFALFNNEDAKNAYVNEFYYASERTSHLLTPHPKGRKYWLVWSYSPSDVLTMR